MQVYGVFQNSEPTEGRGLMLLDKLFEDQDDAKAYMLSQSDYPMWEVRQLPVETSSRRG